MPKHLLFENILLHIQGLKCGENVYELEDHVGHEALNSNLLAKLGLIKIIPLACFSNRILKTCKLNLHFLIPNGPPSRG